MKTPRYTDTARYPHGYVRAQHTDIRRTFSRARKAMAEAEEATKRVLVPLKQKSTKELK